MILQNLVNGAINIINGFIDKLNKLFVSIGLLNRSLSERWLLPKTRLPNKLGSRSGG